MEGRKYRASGGEEILIRAARTADIPQIISLLKNIQITPENLDVKLLKNNRDSFENKGGFFVILNAGELSRLLQNSKNLILIAVLNEQGTQKVCGFLWCRLSLDTISVSDWRLDNGVLSAEGTKKYHTALEDDLIFTAVECAVHPNGNGIAFGIIYEMYNWLMQRGFLYAVLQIYRIRGEYREGCFVKGELPNEASINHIKKYGAFSIKKASVPDQTVGHRRIKVSADVFLLEMENAVRKLRKLVRNNGLHTLEPSGTGGHV